MNKSDLEQDTIDLINLSSGLTVDEEGVVHDTPFDRNSMKLGQNNDYTRLQVKLFFLETIVFIVLLFSIFSAGSSLFKDSPEHYIQKPNGLVEKIDVMKNNN